MQRHTFTKENPSVVIEFPEPTNNQALPTLADLYIKYPFNDNLYYPKENFNFEVIEEVENSLLNEREIYWISFYNSLVPNGYNLTAGGEGTKSYSRQ